MTYFIFLKSLRSLEEFRKNPHIKIPPKSACANFQSLGIFKNQILFGNHFFLRFWPNRPSPEQPRPLHPQAAVCTLGPLGLSSLDVFAKRRLFFEFAQSINDVSSQSLPTGPHQSDPPPSSRRSTRSMPPPMPRRNGSPHTSWPPSLRRQSKPLTPPL
jgi:hypothetical protein